jgi:hypothetical protein
LRGNESGDFDKLVWLHAVAVRECAG